MATSNVPQYLQEFQPAPATSEQLIESAQQLGRAARKLGILLDRRIPAGEALRRCGEIDAAAGKAVRS